MKSKIITGISEGVIESKLNEFLTLVIVDEIHSMTLTIQPHNPKDPDWLDKLVQQRFYLVIIYS